MASAMERSAKRTGFVTHPLCAEHDPGAAHPERPARLAAVRERVERSGLAAALEPLPARPATDQELERIHGAAHVAAMRAACARAPLRLDADTVVSAASCDAALRAAGGAVQACEQVLAGRWSNAFVAVRPPGHHAERDHAMGFCLFNS